MANHEFTNLKEFFNKVKTVGFIERIFYWRNVVSLSHEAYKEFGRIDLELSSINDELNKANSRIRALEQDKDHLKEIKVNLEADKRFLEQKKEDINEKNKELEKEIASNNKVEKQKQEDYEHKVTELNSLKKQLDGDRLRVEQERKIEIEEHHENMKKTWKEHETNVKETIKRICSQRTIEYVKEVPFKGNPDNTLQIAGEYIIFDAKSPSGEDLSNFPKYVKSQAEAAKKYAKEKDVKKDIFLVIPTNTVHTINETSYNLVDYNVYVITLDALEPIILALRKIEDYEFAEQLSPEDRNQICRIIGKFAHATKRRIQIDHFFAREFINILDKCTDLPKDLLDGAVEAEKSGKMNPPMEKRVKVISTADLKNDNKKIGKKAEGEDINIKADLKVIDNVPLYVGELAK
ncbi:MAG: hypothetical protein KJ597_02250 [Nanoarchaeota archaeon]|nr:hypothetical protein [Nanoarchaeota archaeon]MBU1622373.1 hypothetical protein [Nanoarchaeota archaeon]